MDNKNKGLKGSVKFMMLVVFVVVVLLFSMVYHIIHTGQKTGNFWGDLFNAKGPWSSVERFWDEKILGYSDEDMHRLPGQNSLEEEPAGSPADRFDE